VFCERCGLNFLPKQSVCTRCNASATRHWFQLMSLLTLLVAVACNTVVAFLLLPRLTAGAHPKFIFRAWLWFDHKMGLYGWVPIAMGLLAWDYLVWKEARPKIRGWVLAWGVVLVVVVLLCVDAESRDYLLGHGKVLSIVSLSMLLVVLAMTMASWALSA